MCAVVGVGVAFTGESQLLRPPGGQDEDRFESLCLKCDRCRSVCPCSCLTIATLENGVINARTPRIDFHKGYCNFCGKCADVCPTGAILPGFDPDGDKIGIAVVDHDECLAFRGGGCERCVDACPYDAIDFSASYPVVDASRCNGCGQCEYVCPSNVLRSFSGSRSTRGINVCLEDEAAS